MCGRYTLKTPVDELQAEFALQIAPLELRARWNLAPTQDAPVVVQGEERALVLYRWGLIPSWAKDAGIGSRAINARAETLAERPAFREVLKTRRALVVADGFYEWRREGKTKIPLYIHRQGGGLLAFAGLWDEWVTPTGAAVRSFCIITTSPNPLMARFHDRMPAILSKPDYETWLGATATDTTRAGLLQPYAGEDLEATEVGDWVNAPANDSPECLAPRRVEPARQGELFGQTP